MKKMILKSLLLASLILPAAKASPANPSSGKDERSVQTENTIKSSLKFISINPSEEKVEVLFSTGDNGNINFVLAKTNNAALRKEIEKQFYNLKFPFYQKKQLTA